MKLKIIYNSAPTYRGAIFKMIDDTWECEWYFAPSLGDIKSMDSTVLKKVKHIYSKRFGKCLYWQKGVVKTLKDSTCRDYIILGDLHALSTWAFLLTNLILYRKNIYIWTHGWYGRESRLKKILKKLYFGMATKILPYGDYAKELAVKNGFEESKIFPIHNSLDHEQHKKIRFGLQQSSIFRAHFGNSNPTLIFIGRLTKIKKLDILIDAIALLKQEDFHLNLVLVGDGVVKDSLEKLVGDRNLKENVWFYGRSYDDSETAQLIYDADLCVSPGNVGLTAIHAMTFGTPVISHNNFPMQMPEFETIQPGTTGDFFEEGSIESLAQTIKKWIIQNSSKRDEIRENCYRQIEQSWTPDFQIKVLKSVIQK